MAVMRSAFGLLVLVVLGAGCGPTTGEPERAVPTPPPPASALASASASPPGAGPTALRLNRRVDGALQAATFSRDGKTLATWCAGGCERSPAEQTRVLLWSLPSLEVTGEILPDPEDMGGGRVHNVSFNADGSRLAISTHNGVSLYRASDRAPLVSLSIPAIYGGFAFSPDGRYLAATGVYGHVAVVEAATGAQVLADALHNGAGSMSAGISWTRDSRWLVAEGNANFGLWTPGGGKKLTRLPFAGGGTGHEALSAGDRWLLLSSLEDCHIEVFSMATRRLARRISAPRTDTTKPGVPCAATFDATGERLAVLHNDGAVKLWDPSSQAPPETVRPADKPESVTLSALLWSPDRRSLLYAVGPTAAVRGADGKVVPLPSDPDRTGIDWAGDRVVALARGDDTTYLDLESGATTTQPPPAPPEGLDDPTRSYRVIASGDLRFLREDGAELLVRTVLDGDKRRTVVVDVAGHISGDPTLAASDVYDERRGAKDLPSVQRGVAERFFAGVRSRP